MGADIPDDTPKLPESVAYLWELHKSIRFSVVPSSDRYFLMPRPPLTILEISEYLDRFGIDLEQQEFDVILSIDAIFEKHRG